MRTLRFIVWLRRVHLFASKWLWLLWGPMPTSDSDTECITLLGAGGEMTTTEGGNGGK